MPNPPDITLLSRLRAQFVAWGYKDPSVGYLIIFGADPRPAVLYDVPVEGVPERRYYVLDKHDPRPTKQRYFRFPHSDADWFVAGYSDDHCLRAPHAEYHPFGHNYVLCRWRSPHPIDIDRNHPLPRVAVEFLPTTL